MVSKRVRQHTDTVVLKSSYNLRPRPTNPHTLLPPRTSNDVEQHSSLRKCTLRPHTCSQSVPYLTPDIIFAILVYLPADLLYNVVRYVCRDWYDIISSPRFIEAHLLKAERGLLIKQHFRCVNYVGMENNRNPLQLVKVGFPYLKPQYGTSCCNGLVLLSDTNNRHVVNYITKEVITLSPPPNFYKSNIINHTIGCTRSKKYKLVEFYTMRNASYQISLVAGILTLGVDREWRTLFKLNDGSEIDKFGRIDFVMSSPIVSAEGTLHVVHRNLPLVFNLDLETETFYVRAIPECSNISRTYLGTGRSLCFMDYLGNFSWELWLLKDAEAGEWTKRGIIDLRDPELTGSGWGWLGLIIVPVGFLKDGDVVVFIVKYEGERHPSRKCITYNMKTGGISSFELDKWSSTCDMEFTYMYNPHVKSLVSPKFGEN